jgi:proprotein convertase subtilisin/kexin type 5
LSCHAACATCFSSDTASCYSCRTDTVTNTVYYLQLGTTVCSTSCPAGQITGTANLCLACASQCAACSIIQTNCTTCSVLNGASVYLQGETCTPTCTAGSYAKNGTTNNLCLACNIVCSTCFGPSTTNCNSCRNATTAGTTTIYFKDPTNPICSTSCSQGYVGIASSNAC